MRSERELDLCNSSIKCAVCISKTFSRHKIQQRSISILLHVRIGDVCTTPVSVCGWLPAHRFCLPSHLLVFHREWINHYQVRFPKIIYKREAFHRGLVRAGILHHPCCCVNADWDYTQSSQTAYIKITASDGCSHSGSWMGPGNRNM